MDDTPDRVFRRRVREFREALGWSQAKLAELVNDIADQYGMTPLAPNAITRLENGERTIHLHEAGALAAVFGLTIGVMLTASPPEPAELEAAHAELEAARQRFIEAQQAVAAAADRVHTLSSWVQA